jgi:hypothetical protein
MTLIFSPNETIDLLTRFTSSIREGNDSIDKAKLQLLHALTKKTVLWNSDTLAALRELYSTQLERAFKQTRALAAAANPEGAVPRPGSMSSAEMAVMRMRSASSTGPFRASMNITSEGAGSEGTMAGIFRILMSLVFSNASDFVISFVPMLAGVAPDAQIGELLVAIAFSLPRKFPLDVTLTVADSPLLSAPLRLFVLLQIVIAEAPEIRERPKPGNILE